MEPNRKAFVRVGIPLLLLAAALLPLTCTGPDRNWRTGESEDRPLPLVRGGPHVDRPSRVWIDTDAACDGGNADPDDCFAMLVLMNSPDIEIVGISTVFGNAPLSVVDRTTRDLVGRVDGSSTMLVHSGSSTALQTDRATSVEPAHGALERALERGPLTIVSLGPLTNVAETLRRRPDLADNIGLLVSVMGRRPGHVFHPTEGRNSSGILFGHGPIFRDFNFSKDRASAAIVLGLAGRISLTPYVAAREVMVTRRDLARMEGRPSRDGVARGKGRAVARLLGTRHRSAGFLPFRCARSALRPSPPAIPLREGLGMDRRGRSAASTVARCAWLNRIARRPGIRSTADHAGFWCRHLLRRDRRRSQGRIDGLVDQTGP